MVASQKQCYLIPRMSSGLGVDAVIRARQQFAEDSLYTRFSIEVQLKATSDQPALDERGRYPFPLRLDSLTISRKARRSRSISSSVV
jgi:hypothetical protein